MAFGIEGPQQALARPRQHSGILRQRRREVRRGQQLPRSPCRPRLLRGSECIGHADAPPQCRVECTHLWAQALGAHAARAGHLR